MASINPFDDLGRILASGGYQSFITAAASGSPLPILIAAVHERYHQLSANDASFLAQYAINAVNAGNQLNADIIDAELAYDIAPINPLLGGLDELGIRYRVSAISNVTNQETGETKRTRHVLNMGASATYDEIIKEIEKMIEQIAEQYPGKFQWVNNWDDTSMAVGIESIQRKY